MPDAMRVVPMYWMYPFEPVMHAGVPAVPDTYAIEAMLAVGAMPTMYVTPGARVLAVAGGIGDHAVGTV